MAPFFHSTFIKCRMSAYVKRNFLFEHSSSSRIMYARPLSLALLADDTENVLAYMVRTGKPFEYTSTYAASHNAVCVRFFLWEIRLTFTTRKLKVYFWMGKEWPFSLCLFVLVYFGDIFFKKNWDYVQAPTGRFLRDSFFFFFF